MRQYIKGEDSSLPAVSVARHQAYAAENGMASDRRDDTDRLQTSDPSDDGRNTSVSNDLGKRTETSKGVAMCGFRPSVPESQLRLLRISERLCLK